jgi:hypothetical protein
MWRKCPNGSLALHFGHSSFLSRKLRNNLSHLFSVRNYNLGILFSAVKYVVLLLKVHVKLKSEAKVNTTYGYESMAQIKFNNNNNNISKAGLV